MAEDDGWPDVPTNEQVQLQNECRICHGPKIRAAGGAGICPKCDRT